MKSELALLGVVVALSACNGGGGCAPAGSSPRVHAGAQQVVDDRPGHRPGEAVSQDGYRIVFGDTRAPGTPTPSHEGEQAEQRAREHLVREPSTPDPQHGPFTLDDAVVNMPIDGQLVVEIGTDLGVMECDLYADKAPHTVANFIGLARGLRPWWDARAGVWQTHHPYYRDTKFHRVIPGYLIQGGDYLGDGTGTIGYEIPDEPHADLRHDRAGLLCMASLNGPNHNGAQFFITDGPAPQLDTAGGATIFGHCEHAEVASRIARVAQTGAPDNRPRTPIYITRLTIRRVPGGAAAAEVTRPTDPDPYVEQHASPGPSELRQEMLQGRAPVPLPPPPRAPMIPPLQR